MFFKDWLNLSEVKYDNMFSQRDKNQFMLQSPKSSVSKKLGFNEPLIKYSQGSLATLYQHPTDKDLLIKITPHKKDVENIIMAQKIESPNVVKAFRWEDSTNVKNLPSLHSIAIIVEKINGTPMVYTNNDFLDLALGGTFEKAADWLLGTMLEKQEEILKRYNKNETNEHYKLAELFKTLNKLKKYRIILSDFDQNILDTADRYVIVDMGF
jgi:hypothetical protein